MGAKAYRRERVLGLYGGITACRCYAHFEIHAQKDFRSLNNGEAARAAYDKFFEGCRTKMHDKRIIHQMLLDDSGYMKVSRKTTACGNGALPETGRVAARPQLPLHSQ